MGVPGADECPGGNDLGGSTFSVKNVRVLGTVVQGKTPPLCSNPGPTSPPNPPGPEPSGCADAWKQCGGQNWNGAKFAKADALVRYRVNGTRSACHQLERILVGREYNSKTHFIL